MNVEEIKILLNSFDESSLKEFEVREEKFKLYMNKGEQNVKEYRILQESNQSLSSSLENLLESLNQDRIESSDVRISTIVSPIVGTVYLSPSLDKPVFKKIGDFIAKGEVICIIEAMKVMNEIVSEVDGIVSGIFVSNEEIVEYGQLLYTIKEQIM